MAAMRIGHILELTHRKSGLKHACCLGYPVPVSQRYRYRQFVGAQGVPVAPSLQAAGRDLGKDMDVWGRGNRSSQTLGKYNARLIGGSSEPAVPHGM